MQTKYVSGRVYNYDYCIGTTGVGGRNFFYPVDFALGSAGSLYVVQKGCEFFPCTGISKCTLDHELIWEDRGRGFMDGQAPMPSSIAVDSQENLYVSDEFTNQVFIFDRDGNRLGSWASESDYRLTTPARASNELAYKPGLMPVANNFSIPFEMYLKKVGAMDTSGDGELNGPTGLTFDQEDRLFISDSHNHRIQIFAKDGTFLWKFGLYGQAEGELNMPWGLAIDKDSNVYVADWGNSRVQKFSAEGQYLATLGAPGSGEGALYRPSSVAVDKDGDVYVTDYDAHRIVIYDSDGNYLVSFHGDAEQLSPWSVARVGTEPSILRARQRADLSIEKNFRWPMAVNLDDEGRIMVMEAVANRIQIYVKEQDWVEPQINL